MLIDADWIAALMTEWGYDADPIRNELAQSGEEAVIFAMASRRELIT